MPVRRARYSWSRICLSAIVPLFVLFSDAATYAETPLTLLRGQTRELLQQEAGIKDSVKKDSGKKAEALTALCDLYVVIRQDQRYSGSEMLKQDAAKIRRRLINRAKQRSSRLKRDDIPRPDGLADKVDSAIKQAIAKAKADSQSGDDSPTSDSESPAKATTLAKAQSIAAGNAGAGAADGGWELVELLQRVVAPDFWDTNGGPGAIHYFAMRRVLVVRATSDVHEQVRDLLKSLPR